jgi:glutamate formiminotransferase/formiminotetrahydrofolate cyclodeaminase
MSIPENPPIAPSSPLSAPPSAVEEAAFLLIQKASQLIDMSQHHGNHPRMGATDVCPFIPVSGTTMQDCIALAKRLGKRVGEELAIPVYLYEEAATHPHRKNLASIRKGEYEGLAEKLQKDEWKPDFGPARFNPKAGAIAIGAREFLIAYNINLNTREREYANDIAFELRHKGRSVRQGRTLPFYSKGSLLKYKENHFPCGNCTFVTPHYPLLLEHCHKEHHYDLQALLVDHEVPTPENPVGFSVRKIGFFPHCKAIGWIAQQYDRAQISINLTNYKVTSVHHVLEKARTLALERYLVVTGSEIVGLLPYQALYDTGAFYLKRQGKSAGIPWKDILETAIQSLGLRDVASFKVKEKVLGLPQTDQGSLVQRPLHDFVDEVSRDTPAPGGGSVAALAGALGAALSSMVSNLALGKQEENIHENTLQELAQNAQTLKDTLLMAIDADTNAFNAYTEALRLPQSTPEEKKIRQQNIQEGLQKAIAVPLQTAQLSFHAMELCHQSAKLGKISSITDAGVGTHLAFAGVQGGIYNVLINLKESCDPAYVQDLKNQCDALLQQALKLREENTQLLQLKIQEQLSL